jgi:prepilin-type N-terminal cleavage/methylation domain-containing protein
MKMLNKKMASLVNLPVAWEVEGWAKPLQVRPSARPCNRGAKPVYSAPAQRCVSARRRRAFTLIEMLVVIAIIGILASLLLPALAVVKKNSMIKSAKVDMNNIAAAVGGYQGQYTLAPVPKQLPNNADNAKDYSYSAFNNEVIVILMDIATNAVPVNLNHSRNPEKQAFLNAKLTASTNGAGVSTIDFNYRDPWGTPYVIAFDLDYDNKVNVPDTVDPEFAQYPYVDIPRAVLVWSRGPDRKAVAGNPNAPENRDNIKGWE